MAAICQARSTGPRKPSKATARQLRMKAEQILKSKKNANVLCEVLEMFNRDEKNYTPILLTVEMLFCRMLRRRDMFEDAETVKSPAKTPDAIYTRWLRSNYYTAIQQALACMKRGQESSRIQALVTCCKMMTEEGNNPLYSNQGNVCFPFYRLQAVFDVLLDTTEVQTALIERFQEYTEYRDVQQYGLKLLSNMAFTKGPTDAYIQNYLELFDVLMKPGLNKTRRVASERHPDDKYLIEKDGTVSVIFDPEKCKAYINRCWIFCVKWPLRANQKNHRRALILLVDRIMPYLFKPVLYTDLLCDSLDSGPSISIIALRGMLELVTKHRINFPDIYDHLYGMFEPEMFATRSKKRLIHLTDVFLSSTRLSETMVAAFAKRMARLALIAPPEDANDLLQLVANIIQRHPGLKKMLRKDQPAIILEFAEIGNVPKDPYVMEETCADASRAIQSSLWEVAALQQHYTPEVSATAMKVLALADDGARPPELIAAYPDHEQFDMEIKRRFKTIEMNFNKASAFYDMLVEERMMQFWDITCD